MPENTTNDPLRTWLKIIYAAIGIFAIIALVILLANSSDKPANDVSNISNADALPDVKPTQKGKIRSGTYDGQYIRFRLPSGSKEVVQGQLGRTEETRFTIADRVARVRIQDNPERETLRDIADTYRSYGNVERRKVKGRNVLLITSSNSESSSTMLVFIRGGRIVYVQVMGDRKSSGRNKASTAEIIRTVDVKG